ncbi:MAG: hypothetical protein ABI847_13200 [Anaerolineales bacterium]
MFSIARYLPAQAKPVVVPAARRHSLLLYEKLYASWRLPSIGISLLLSLLWRAAPAPLNAEPVHSVLLAGALAALLMFLYSLVAARLSYVECTPTHLRVSTPFFWLAVSYNRVRLVKPVKFTPGRMPLGRRRYAQPLDGQTQVAVELFHYPVHRNWLRLWLNEFILATHMHGMQFLVSDWMALSRDIEVGRSLWQARVRDQARQQALTSMLQPRRF